MKILTIAVRRHQLTWALFLFPQERELASGIIEGIGKKEGLRWLHWNTLNDTKVIHLESFDNALHSIIDELLNLRVIDSIDEIEAVGHRFVAGGEYAKEPTMIPRESAGKLEKLGQYILLNNSLQVEMATVFQRFLPHVRNIAVFDTLIESKKHSYAYQLRIRQTAMHSRPFVQCLNDAVHDGRMIAESVHEIIREKIRV